MDQLVHWLVVPLILLTYGYTRPLARAHTMIPRPAAQATEAPPVQALPDLEPHPQVPRHQAMQAAHREEMQLEQRMQSPVLDKFRNAFASMGHKAELGDLAINLAGDIGLDPLVLYALIDVESGFDCGMIFPDPNGTRDYGCMQLNDSSWPGMAHSLGLAGADPLNPEQNLRMGTWYLSMLHRQFGTWEATLTAYNMGEYGLARIQRVSGGSSSTYSRAVLGEAERLHARLASE